MPPIVLEDFAPSNKSGTDSHIQSRRYHRIGEFRLPLKFYCLSLDICNVGRHRQVPCQPKAYIVNFQRQANFNMQAREALRYDVYAVDW